jgi:hypothetical protein
MAKTLKQYTLQDFNNILLGGFIYDLKDSNVIELISSLSNKVGAPTYIKTPVFPIREKPNSVGVGVGGTDPSHSHSYSNSNASSSSQENYSSSTLPNRRPRNKPLQISDEDWTLIRTFQKTEIKKTEGIEKRVDVIRSLLNKLTDATYSVIESEILSEVNNIIKGEGECEEEKCKGENVSSIDEENIYKIAHSIFNTASSNMFYSALYAKLFKQLVQCHDIFTKVFEKSYSEFVGLFKKVEYVDPSLDYNKFCEVTKMNDKRKAMSMFIINLMKEDMLELDGIVEIIVELQEMVNSYIKQANKTNELEELNENMFILVTNGKDALSTHEKWESIVSNIKFWSMLTMKKKEYPSVNNKLIFKNMDMLEELGIN